MPTRFLRGVPADSGLPVLAERALTPVEGPPGPDSRYSILHAGRRSMLDHILVSRHLAANCRYAAVHNEGLRDEAAPHAEELPDSFHAPVVAQFTLPSITQPKARTVC